MSLVDDYRAVLTAYPDECRGDCVEQVDLSRSFSGALLWKIQTPSGPLALRRWPSEHPTRDRLEFIQAVLWHVDQQGCHLVPVPRETRNHSGYVDWRGHLWELIPWLDGRADFAERRSPARVAAAMGALAEFHLATVGFPLPHDQPSPPPGILDRQNQLRQLQGGELATWPQRMRPHAWNELDGLALEIVRIASGVMPSVATEIEHAVSLVAPVLPCIRDIWSEHVLFSGDRVSGLIDFGAMRPDSVAADIARLLGSLVGADADARAQGIGAYESMRRLTPNEHALIDIYDRSATLLGALNWVRWLYLEDRQFGSRAEVRERVEWHLEGLRRLAARQVGSWDRGSDSEVPSDVPLRPRRPRD